MNEAQCWKLIEGIGWGTKTTDYRAVARQLYSTMSKSEVAELNTFVKKKVEQLGMEVARFEGDSGETLTLGSDDTFSDVRYHIVGLGEGSWKCAMLYPYYMEDYVVKGLYKESFAYCFHEPEPVRTEANKAKSVQDLANGMRQLDEQINALQNAVDTVREKWSSLYRLGQLIEEMEREMRK